MDSLHLRFPSARFLRLELARSRAELFSMSALSLGWYLSIVNGRRTATQIACEYRLPVTAVEERVEIARLLLERRVTIARTRKIARIRGLFAHK